ncbi:MAG: hypothetical protein JNJ61_19860 [Anaerolineae bacterium]|nr:hypothetical protein [Anaerolineae bacterium]
MRSIIDFVESVLAGLLILVLLILNPLLRHWTNRWGARDSEVRATLPGDERTPNARLAYTRAISIRAAPAQVWPWLIQIGQEKGGLYSYEMLENLIGCKMRNADRIVAEWQHIAPGDAVRLGPPGYPLFRVVDLQSEHWLLMAGADPQTGEMGVVKSEPEVPYIVNNWLLYLSPQPDGTTRLITRSRMDYRPANFANAFMWRGLMEPMNFVMEQKMLHGIKARVEAQLSPAVARA